MITLEFKTAKFALTAQRKAMAHALSCVIAAGLHNGLPYTPEEAGTTFWTLDAGNDWHLVFYESEPAKLTISYRYGAPGNAAEPALEAWLRWRFHHHLAD